MFCFEAPVYGVEESHPERYWEYFLTLRKKRKEDCLETQIWRRPKTPRQGNVCHGVCEERLGR